MEDDSDQRLLYKSSSITLLQSYIAIEKFLIDTRLSFFDQFKLFDLLKKFLPVEENRLTSQGFLSWLIWRVDQQPTSRNKRSCDQITTIENACVNKRLRTTDESHSTQIDSDDTHLVQYTQSQIECSTRQPSDLQQQIDRLQSIVLRLASHIDTLNHQSSVNNDRSSAPIEPIIKHEYTEDNEHSEFELAEGREDELSDAKNHLNFPVSNSIDGNRRLDPITSKTIIYQGRNMMKHLRPRTTLTSFARHVASDLFSREEIMAKVHVDHNDERDIFLRHCIRTVWNLTEQELHGMWPKIRNALLQLRRDALAGKCIRINKQNRQESEHDANPYQYSSDFDEDRNCNSELEIMRLSLILNAAKAGRQLLVSCESQATGHRVMRIRERTQEKLEFLRVDPWIDQEVLYKEARKIKTLEKRNAREIQLSRLS